MALTYTKDELCEALENFLDIKNDLDGYNIEGNRKQFIEDGYPPRVARAFAYMPIIAQAYIDKTSNHAD